MVLVMQKIFGISSRTKMSTPMGRRIGRTRRRRRVLPPTAKRDHGRMKNQ